jgi:OOP family OmpA-OmpF porin
MKKIAIAALLSVVVAPAVAADEPHMYAGVRVGQAKTSIDNTTLTTSNPTAFGVFLGHTFSPNFGIEGEYLALGEIKGAGGGSAKSNGFSVSGVGSYPINDQFSVFGKLGYAMITSKLSGGGGPDVNAKSNGVTYGLGGQYNVSPGVGIRLGWDKYKLNHTDATVNFKGNVSLISVGAVFKF